MTFCLNCNKNIKKRNKFCGSSCAATFNNLRRPSKIKPEQIQNCLHCNKSIIRRPNEIKKGHKLFCNNSCYKAHKMYNLKNEFDCLFSEGKIKRRPVLRKLVIQRDGYKCSNCNNSTWLNAQIPLWLDHIDGNASNNLPNNLRMICLNCDALNSTFGGKNRGKGRKSLGLKPWE
jgi:hypothetical protein